MNGAFTATLERERLKHATELEKSHGENKTLRSSNERLEKELAESKAMVPVTNRVKTSGMPGTSNPVIGTFYTHELRSPAQSRAKWSSIYFANPYSLPPALPLGFNKLDIGNNDNINVNAYPNNIQKDHFDIHIDSGSNATLNGVGCTWLEIDRNDLDFQFGKFNTTEDHPVSKPQALTSCVITFPRAYSAPPRVIVWLSAVNMSREKVWRLYTYTSDITATGFKIHIDSWYDTILYSATASWLAHSEGKSNVSSGSFGTWDVRPWNPPLLHTSGYVNFDNAFAAPPQVMLVIKRIEIGNEHVLRLKVKASDISTAGMIWHLDGWSDTTVYSAEASYIALG